MKFDFWEAQGEGFKLFSQFCHVGDWNAILDALTEALTPRKETARPMAILDVGCGYGYNTLAILKRSYCQHEFRHTVDLVEPSMAALEHAKAVLSTEPYGCFRRHAVRTIGDRPYGSYDRILYIHSAYYVQDLLKELRYLKEKHAYDHTRLIFLCLSQSSKFYKPSGSILPNCKEDISAILDRLGAPYSINRVMTSRLILPDLSCLTHKGMKALKAFMGANDVEDSTFANRMRKITSDNKIDFEDHLICAEFPD